ncbi:hypothetical protein MLD38_010837 [Melastoma candidum]|uniref:Uncharacterized protein n=1 Tax=Melastoma candidum TaxID=119954 RepID=A0ACB9R2F5_9MYRT|nr:hypothetical protein MLD38_010837 [Melastoma candidum]
MHPGYGTVCSADLSSGFSKIEDIPGIGVADREFGGGCWVSVIEGGEVLGSMKALMVLQDEIQINRRQCCLLLDVFAMAFTVIAGNHAPPQTRGKYDKEWNDRKLFQLRYGKEYLVSKELSKRLDTAWKEDRWLLQELLREKRRSETLSKMENQLADYLFEKLSYGDPFHWMLFNSTTLTGATDYQNAQGMEYLHSQKAYHGNLNPSNVFVKTRTSPEGHIRVKVSGFGFPSDVVNGSSNAQPSLCEDSTNPFICL